tara:strand:- start:309 stop:479 length:171 start_codon:yes stop_codon:yes gene_type:complete
MDENPVDCPTGLVWRVGTESMIAESFPKSLSTEGQKLKKIIEKNGKNLLLFENIKD